MESLTIQPNSNISINDLVSFQERGFSVMRSAHVGNLSPYNLSLAANGIRMLLVDHNITGVDKNYFPALQLTQTTETRIADDGFVVSRIKTDDGFLDEVHIDAITQALPTANVFTNTEYLRDNDTIAAEITNIALEVMPEIFERIVRSDGTAEKSEHAANLVAKLGILQLNDDPRAEEPAILMPNLLDILINFVAEAINSQQDVQYHISGPDMVRYIGAQQADLARLYSLVRQHASFGSQLPNLLTVQLAPAASARFATTEKNKANLESLFETFDASNIALASLSTKRKKFFSSEASKNAALRQEFIVEASAKEAAIKRNLAIKAEQTPGLFNKPRTTGFVTQYDVIEDGGLFVPKQNTAMTFDALGAFSKHLQDLRKRTSP